MVWATEIVQPARQTETSQLKATEYWLKVIS